MPQEITSADFEKLKDIAREAGVTVIEDSLNVSAGILYMDISGTFENGKKYLTLLNKNGINQVIDGNFETKENSVIFAKDATQGRIWIDIVDDAPLFREGETVEL